QEDLKPFHTSPYIFIRYSWVLIYPHLITPPPKVFSSVLTFYPKSDVDLSLCENLQKITEKAFSQRRKMLRSTLKGSITEEQLISLNINPTDRAENLSLEQFIALTKMLTKN
nr:hypothetical protein [Pseudomonadota bacterium]